MIKRTLLNVEKSARGKRWALRVDESIDLNSYKIALGYDDLLSRLIAGRDISIEESPGFLDPKIKNYMPDPSSMQDVDLAASIIVDAIETKKKIAIFADYDVDGATSASQLIRWGRFFGHEFDLYVPDRIKEGYGPSEQAFHTLQERGAELVITVDCGAASHSALRSAEALGLDIIVIDHHLMEGDLPPCKALINPNRPDDNSGLGFLAAAGVTFMVLAALNRELRQREYADMPNLMDFLGLTALGTICDVVPLTKLNRAIVRQGLKVLSSVSNPGIAALADVANISPPYTVYHAGFVIGPRINAGGRIGQADMGAYMLSTENSQLAYKFASELDRVNVERKKIQQTILYEASENVATEDNLENNNVVVIAMPGWHPGIIGIVAGRLKEQIGLPVIIIGIDDDGMGKGSGRSIKGVNLGGAISAAKNEGLLISGGGHAMAGGLSIEAEKIEEFEVFIQDFLRDEVAIATSESYRSIDSLMHPKAVSNELIQLIDRVGPYGANNPEPVFVFDDMAITYSERLRGGHVRCRFTAKDGHSLNGICFSAEENGLSKILLESKNERVHVAARLKQDSWKGRTRIDLHVVDLALVKKK